MVNVFGVLFKLALSQSYKIILCYLLEALALCFSYLDLHLELIFAQGVR